MGSLKSIMLTDIINFTDTPNPRKLLKWQSKPFLCLYLYSHGSNMCCDLWWKLRIALVHFKLYSNPLLKYLNSIPYKPKNNVIRSKLKSANSFKLNNLLHKFDMVKTCRNIKWFILRGRHDSALRCKFAFIYFCIKHQIMSLFQTLSW